MTVGRPRHKWTAMELHDSLQNVRRISVIGKTHKQVCKLLGISYSSFIHYYYGRGPWPSRLTHKLKKLAETGQNLRNTTK